MPFLQYLYCIHRTNSVAGLALCAVVFVNKKPPSCLFYCIEGACLLTEATEDTFPLFYLEYAEPADFCTAVFITYVLFIFIPEIFDRRENRIGCALTKAAERTSHDKRSKPFKFFYVSFLTVTRGNFLEYLKHLVGAD